MECTQLEEAVRAAADGYEPLVRGCIAQLAEVWGDLETAPDEQEQELRAAIDSSRGAWTSAVASANERRQAVRDGIQAALAEIVEIKDALGGDDAEADEQEPRDVRGAHKSLRAWEHDVQAKARRWQKARLQRVSEYEELQARIRSLRQLFGLAPLPPPDKPDISRASLEFLKLELERLAAEKVRREDLLRCLLDELAAVCRDIGEDAKAAAADAHPSLRFAWDGEAAGVLCDIYKLDGGPAGSRLDLSDAGISRLSAKVSAMRDLKAERAAHAAEVLGVLHSLWDALGPDVPAGEREFFIALMAGPLRLHARSLEKTMGEVRRLEGVRAQNLIDVVNTKADDLRRLCADSHVAEPAGLAEALEDLNSDGRNPGAAADMLAKLLHMLAEVQVLAGKRSAIISGISELQVAQEEEQWLAAYEADEQRYKGRDANKRLQRAIRAGKLRERMPAMVDELRAALAEWLDTEGEPFMFDGRDYEAEVLSALAASVHAAAEQRAAKAAKAAAARRQSSAGGSAGGAGPPPAGAPTTPRSGGGAAARPASAVAGSPGPARRADGPSTPIPAALRSVSSRSLSERHSVCVVRSGGGRGDAGVGALGRSGEVRLPRAAGELRAGSSPKDAAAAAVATARPAAGTSTPRRTAGAVSVTAAATPRGAGAASAAALTPRTAAAARDARGGSGAHSSGSNGTCGSSSTSTTSKLDSIFRRSSAQHPVAKLAASSSGAPAEGPKHAAARTAATAGQSAAAAGPAATACDQGPGAADQDVLCRQR